MTAIFMKQRVVRSTLIVETFKNNKDYGRIFNNFSISNVPMGYNKAI